MPSPSRIGMKIERLKDEREQVASALLKAEGMKRQVAAERIADLDSLIAIYEAEDHHISDNPPSCMIPKETKQP